MGQLVGPDPGVTLRQPHEERMSPRSLAASGARIGLDVSALSM